MTNQAYLLFILAALAGCESGTGDTPTAGTETNWLTSCAASDECKVGSCVCGRCTFQCSTTSDCDQAPAAARCAQPSDDAYAAECSDATVSGICVAAGGNDDDSSADDDVVGSDDDGTDDDTSSDDDLAGDDDDTSGDDDLAGDDDGTDDDASSDDDLAGDDDGTDDDVSTGGGAASGGRGNEGGASSGGRGSEGGAGTSGAGGGPNQGGCLPGCTELCAGDVCGCACDPTADWAACEAPTDCTLVPSNCCTCTDFDAVNSDRIEEHQLAVCPDPAAVTCDQCQPEPDPYRVASCIEGVCALVQLDETPITECTQDADCGLDEPTCCPSCVAPGDPQLEGIAENTSRAADLRTLLCDPNSSCVACATPFPPDYEAVCNAGRCAVAAVQPAAASCPAPDGTDVEVVVHDSPSGNGFECPSGVLAPTLITNQSEYDDFLAQCGADTFGDPTVAPSVDFGSRVLFAAVGFETVDLSFNYARQTADGIHVGVTRRVYCGGAAPPDSVLLVEMDTTALSVVQDVCSEGMCSGELPP